MNAIATPAAISAAPDNEYPVTSNEAARPLHRFMVNVSEVQLAALDRLAAEIHATRAEVLVSCAFGLLSHGRDDGHAELRQLLQTHIRNREAVCCPDWFLNPRHPSLVGSLAEPGTTIPSIAA